MGPTGVEGGVVGSATGDAVSVSRERLGLHGTGACGPLAWEGMTQLARDVIASSQTGEGQYPGYAVGEGESA